MLKQVIKADIMTSDIDKTLQEKCEKFGCSIPDWSCCPKGTNTQRYFEN